jgi:transcriptional regulator with XRE-family HTH domain
MQTTERSPTMKPNRQAPQQVDVHVGSRVRTLRTLLGISQAKLGRAIGVTFQQVQKYEHGTTRISCSRLAQIATFLEVSPSFFFDGFDNARDNAESHHHHSVDEITIAKEAASLSSDQRELLLYVIRQIQSKKNRPGLHETLQRLTSIL